MLGTTVQLPLEVKLILPTVEMAGSCFPMEAMSLTCYDLEGKGREKMFLIMGI